MRENIITSIKTHIAAALALGAATALAEYPDRPVTIIVP